MTRRGGESRGILGDDEVFTSSDDSAFGKVIVDAIEVPVADIDIDDELVVEFDVFESAVVSEGLVVDFVEDDGRVAGGVCRSALRGSAVPREKENEKE